MRTPPVKESSDDFVKLWLQVAGIHRRSGNYELAAEAYSSALHLDSVNNEALVGLGEVLKAIGRYEEAEKHFQKALNGKGQKDGRLWALVAVCKLKAGCPKDIVTSCLDRGLKELSDARDTEFWYCMGVVYQHHHEDDLAAETYIQILEWSRSCAKADDIYFKLGSVLRNLGRFQEAFSCFQYLLTKYFSYKEVGKGVDPRRLPKFPSDVTVDDIHSEIGLVKEKEGDLDGARQYYLDVLQVNEQDIQSDKPIGNVEKFFPRVLRQLGWVHSCASFELDPVEQYKLSVKLLHRSVECYSSDDTNEMKKKHGISLSWYLLGRVYSCHGVFDEAYEAYHKAIKLNSTNPLFWCSFGIMCFELSNRSCPGTPEQEKFTKMTLEAYSTALRLDNRFGEAWYNLGVLYYVRTQLKDAESCFGKAVNCSPNNSIFEETYLHLRECQVRDFNDSKDEQSLLSSKMQCHGSVNSLTASSFPVPIRTCQNRNQNPNPCHLIPTIFLSLNTAALKVGKVCPRPIPLPQTASLEEVI